MSGVQVLQGAIFDFFLGENQPEPVSESTQETTISLMTTLQQASFQKNPGTTGKKPHPQQVTGSPMEQLTTYLKGVRIEWTKISWPTTQQIIGQIIVVLAVVSIMTLILFVMDFSFHFIVNAITPHRS